MIKFLSSLIIFTLIFGFVWLLCANLNADSPEKLADKSRELFQMINQERLSLGIPELIWDEELASLATEHSMYMAETDVYEHSRSPYAENIMVGCNPKDVFKAWKESFWHYANMTNSSLKYGAVGMGIVLKQVQIGNMKITYNTSRGFSTFLGRH